MQVSGALLNLEISCSRDFSSVFAKSARVVNSFIRELV